MSKRLAGSSLLESYTAERRPVDAVLVHQSNNGICAHANLWEVIGMSAPTHEDGAKQLAMLSEATPEGEALE